MHGGPLLHVFTLNGSFPDVLTETKFCSLQIVTSEAATSVSEALPADADSASACGGNARTVLPK